MQGYRRASLALTLAVVPLEILAFVLLLPALGAGITIAVMVIIAAAFAVASFLVLFRGVRELTAAQGRIALAHPGALVVLSGASGWAGATPAARASVIAVVADRNGLSLRDRLDGEVHLVPADGILSVELAPLNPRSAFRPLRVSTIDGSTIDIIGPLKPDEQVDAVVTLREALGRASI
jgi:hypothetical protein